MRGRFLLFIALSNSAFGSALGSSTDDFQALIVSSDVSYLASEKDLEYTGLDAKRLQRALISAGRIPSGKIANLTNPSLAEFDATILNLEKKSSQKFMFYFSGHSDEHGLHFKDGALTKSKFHSVLAKISAKVKIVILDSCFSGALKSKGVKKDKAIELVEYNVDQPTGSVILTSSSEREFSYESEKLKGSVFSYHLVSGIYGQADANNDGLVTIDELYQYVYSQTKFQSMVSGGKIQSPEFESKLTGQGALVVSYPARINGKLALSGDVRGELTLATAKGINFFRFYKNKGEAKTVSLPRGVYEVTVLEEGRIGKGNVEVFEQETQDLSPQSLTWEKREIQPVRAKGAQSKFLFGLSFNSQPSFFPTEAASMAGELFLLTPSIEGLGGRWRLTVHIGGQTHEINGTQSKAEYSRLSFGGEGSYAGWSRLSNEWLIGARVGTFTAGLLPQPNVPGMASLSRIYVGSRFFPENWKLNWDIVLGLEGIKSPNFESRTVSTLGFALNF